MWTKWSAATEGVQPLLFLFFSLSQPIQRSCRTDKKPNEYQCVWKLTESQSVWSSCFWGEEVKEVPAGPGWAVVSINIAPWPSLHERKEAQVQFLFRRWSESMCSMKGLQTKLSALNWTFSRSIWLGCHIRLECWWTRFAGFFFLALGNLFRSLWMMLSILQNQLRNCTRALKTAVLQGCRLIATFH